MKRSHTPEWASKALRYTSAYLWFALFTLLSLLITWCLRSDLLVLSVIFKSPIWLSNLFERWGTFLILIPYILLIGVLESYFNSAARKAIVAQRALRILLIAGPISALVLALMLVLFLLGYPPVL